MSSRAEAPRPERPIDRRTFVRGSVAAAAGSYLTLTGSARASGVRTREERRSVIVLGSGFGGAITAYRLAQAGVDVTLIERGRRWPAGGDNTFPTALRADKRTSWLSHENSMSVYGNLIGGAPFLPQPKYTGVVERIKGTGMSIVCGSAYGGGSLPYQGMWVKPRADIFSQVMPAELDYEELDARWYPLAGKVLGIASMPDDVYHSREFAGSREFSEIIEKAGFPATTRVPMVVDWDIVREEIAGKRRKVFSRADVAYGANSPAKRSLDTNYLPAAEATGRVDVLTLHEVKEIGRDGAGRWTLAARRINTSGKTLELVNFTTDALFLSAGSGNTSKLLVEAKGRGTIDDLPDDTGKHWGNNGDLISFFMMPRALGGNPADGGPAQVASLDWDNPNGPVTILYAPTPLPGNIFGMGSIAIHLPSGLGDFRYSTASGKSHLVFPPGNRNPTIAEARRRIDKVGRAAGALFKIDQTALEPTTWHPLGGAVIGKVTDAYGRVQGQKGLYVTDGSLIPGTTAACNPSLTIAAVAERNVDQWIKKDLGTVFNGKL